MIDIAAGPDGATPLTEGERRGLLPPVLTRAELNRAEATNIGRASAWLFLSQRRLRPGTVADEEWLKRLHKRMYGEVWSWAGQYRTADRNLGVPFWRVCIDMRDLLEDVRGWLADTTGTRYGDDECAIRFGYRLVAIHPFPNGNGRWSRLAADALIVALGGSRFTWGGGVPAEPGVVRRQYINALQAADKDGDVQQLLAFSRS